MTIASPLVEDGELPAAGFGGHGHDAPPKHLDDTMSAHQRRLIEWMESARSTQLAMVTDSAGGNMATSRAKCMAPAAISLELEMPPDGGPATEPAA